MDDMDRLVENMRFLAASTRKLSDSFQDAEDRVRRGFSDVAGDVEALERRLAAVESQLLGISDLSISLQRERSPELPPVEATAGRLIPALNLPLETILDVYFNAPVLLEPFSRPCAISAKTLTDQIDYVELEVSTHTMTWVIETGDLGWLLIPRLGLLERTHQLQALTRLFEIRGSDCLPVTLQLRSPAVLESVILGQKWQLVQRGILDVNPDPTQVSLSERFLKIENRMAGLEQQVNP